MVHDAMNDICQLTKEEEKKSGVKVGEVKRRRREYQSVTGTEKKGVGTGKRQGSDVYLINV